MEQPAYNAPFVDIQEKDDEVLAFNFGAYLNSLEKVAVSTDTKRLIVDRMIKPAVGAGTMLTTLALLSRSVGRNLYGGFDKVRTDDDVKNKGRIMIDIPVDDLKGSKKNILVKQAGVDVSKLQKLKDALDARIVKGPKVVRKLDKLLADKEAVQYKGKTGLAHWLIEEVPFKAVESVAYAAPMTAIALATGRNAKRAFEPIVSDPNHVVPEGMARITIEENSGKEKKADTEDLERFDPTLDGVTTEPTKPYITNNEKQKVPKESINK